MTSRKLLFLAVLAFGQLLAFNVHAQQLYVSDIYVGYNDQYSGSPTVAVTSTAYCNSGPFSHVDFLTGSGNVWQDSSRIEFERPRFGPNPNRTIDPSDPGVVLLSTTALYPGNCLSLCATIVCVSTVGVFGIDDLTFEIFKFGAGSNPLDPASTPPIKTISMYNIGQCESSNNVAVPVGTYCTAWDGAYNLNGFFGKTNGQYGFRAKVRTNQVSATAGNISIEQTAAFPGQNQIPVQVDVLNIHTVRSSPTVVGRTTGVSAQPYNILYRLSKDALVTIKVYDANTPLTMPLVRTIIANAPRTGEGAPDGTITNGDFWDGRDNGGNLVAGGNYVAQIDAWANDMWQPPTDLAWPATVQLSLDPLIITDVAIKPLGASSTDVAVISYLLTEAAEVYVDIYSSGTIIGVNSAPPAVSNGTLLRRFVGHKDRRTPSVTYWDGRDSNGNPVCDGEYQYAIYAVVSSSSNFAPGGQVWTRRTMVGAVPVHRGSVISLLSPSSTVVGSSPTAADLNPFFFRYTPVRDTLVTLNILDMGSSTVRNVVNNVTRTNISNREMWDGRKDNGEYVPSGLYQAELITNDPFQCSSNRVSTITARFSADMFRTVDWKTSPLLGGASDTARVSFEFSQTLFMELNIYPINVVVDPSKWPWPSPATFGEPVYSVIGMRPGRFNITEYWDGRDKYGLLVPDGSYPFTLVAHTTGTAQIMYATDKVSGSIDITRGKIMFSIFEVIPSLPTMYSSSDVVKLPPFEVDYMVTRQSSVTVQILTMEQPPRTVAVVTRGEIRDGDTLYKDFWDGKTAAGNFVTGGAYNVRVTAQDIASQLASRATVQQTIDVYPLRIYDVSITPLTLEQPAVVSYQVSEPMKVVTKVFKPGTTFDSSGNAYPPETNSLVKRIIGIRPARTQISEYWDGTDFTLSKVPDGNYVFKLYGSMDTGAISTLDGSYGTGITLADDIVTANIPVTKGGTADLCGDFSHDTFFAPNPYEGTAGWFRIPLIMNGKIDLKIYNLAGDLIYKHDFGILGAGSGITDKWLWPKVNLAGKAVAGGVYFAVIRFEASEGTRDVCQVVKKILVP
ncbi:MAG TPA: hypothetical protein DCL44_03185 [Elusimicrobia bacterium]|nr:hypothetical protein [Elusimicrobiota bacterium]